MSAILDAFLSQIKEESLNLIYAQVRQNGNILQEYSYLPVKTRLNTWSISKSFVSCAVGIAIEEGLLSLDEYVCDAFKDYVPREASENLTSLKVKHLLTMTTGLKEPLFFCDNPLRYTTKDWVAHFFNAEFDMPPGEQFLYSNFNTYILSCMIENRSEENLLEYLRGRLFEPIGINNPDWTLCPMGHIMAANGLYVTIDELANFGDLLLGRGAYGGRQIVPKAYLEQACINHIGHTKPEKKFYGYGYQFWMTPGEGEYICTGNYGQFCWVLPEKNAVISIMSLEGNYNRIKELMFEKVEW